VDELVAFIKARLDEDAEDFAVSIEHCPPTEIYTSDGTVALVPRGVEWYRRMLRGVDAKRRIVDWHTNELDLLNTLHPTLGCRCYGGWPCPTLRLLASEWPTHEAYQEGWRV
jgi:hypothetical protein